MYRNRIRQASREGRISYGAYVMTSSPTMVEMMGCAGLDFVRIDLAESPTDVETVHNMIRAAHAVGITPVVRVPPHDARLIALAVGMGALGIQITHVHNAKDVFDAVQAVKPPPLGEAHIGPSQITGCLGRMSPEEHASWVAENLILSVQVEAKEGIEAIDEIAAVPGLDMLQSGRGDLSYSYGVPGQQYHPLVLEAEEKMINAGKRAGKLVSVSYYPLRDPQQVNTVRDFVRRGVDCISLGTDRDIVNVYRRLLADVKTI